MVLLGQPQPVVHFICHLHGNIGQDTFDIVVQTRDGPRPQRIYCMRCVLEFFDANLKQVKPIIAPTNGGEDRDAP